MYRPGRFSLIARNYAQLTRSELPALSAGQPLYETRPHMLNPGQLTPGIGALEYYERRLRLSTRMEKGSAAIIPSNQIKYASGAVFYPFQQNTDFFYYTGWNEPNSVAVIEKLDRTSPDPADDVVFHMLVQPKDTNAEQWDGSRTGIAGAEEIFNADEAENVSQLRSYIDKVIKRNKYLYYDSSNETGNNFFSKFFSAKGNPSSETLSDILQNNRETLKVRPLSTLSRQLRLIKSDAEIALMRKAGQISGRAYNQAYSKRFNNERTLASFLEYQFISGGCSGNSYVPVVAGGPNALSIHYTRNDDVLYNNELVLVDAGGMIGGYRADISRTWPVNGKFTEPQADLYQAVLNVNEQCITKCQEDENYTLHELHNLSSKLILQELKQLPGLENITSSDVHQLYPHYIGHNLGLDVHDVPGASSGVKLKQNQVITIEPGVYFPVENYNFPSFYRGIGIRIEDNVAIGKDSYTVLTPEAAKQIVDIEHIAAHGVTTPYKQDVVNILE